ncbi:MAG: 6,7-dimethyl-8-ribityllumazine synthase, partial [Actinomycetales bacterium]
MSGHGAPTLTVKAEGARVAIVASSWHVVVMDGLVAGAQSALAEAGVTDVTLVRAAGSFELPLVTQALARAGHDAVIALGVI